MVLSLTLHGLAVLPLFLVAGTLGSAPSEEPALIVEFSLAAPTAGAEAEPDGAALDLPTPPEPPLPTPVEMAEASPVEPPPPEPPPPEPPSPEAAPQPEIAVDLPPPEDLPPLNVTDLKTVERPKRAAARPATKPAAVAQAASTPDTGTAAVAQQATAAPADMIVFEDKPRYRLPPKPAVYPARAQELNQQGEALIRIRLEPDGTAIEIKLWRSSGFALLDHAALAAARGWHIHPAMRGGRPVATWVEVPVRFHLR